MMIFILIAGSYTPLCMVTLRDSVGPLMCLIVWSIAAVGILVKGLLDYLSQVVFFSPVYRHGLGMRTWLLLRLSTAFKPGLPSDGCWPEVSSIP